jgi:hypothetical protein
LRPPTGIRIPRLFLAACRNGTRPGARRGRRIRDRQPSDTGYTNRRPPSDRG